MPDRETQVSAEHALTVVSIGTYRQKLQVAKTASCCEFEQ